MRIKAALSGLLTALAMLPIAPAVAQSAPKPPPIRVTPAQQPRMTERQQEIMLIARNADGYLTEELHNEFWSLIPFAGRQLDEFKVLIADLVEKVIGPSQALGYETWHSADLSLRAGRVIRSDGLDSAIEASLTASDIPTYRAKAQEGVNNVDPILIAAAMGTPLQTPYGPVFINEDMISQTLAGIEGGVRRTKLLLNSNWDPSLQHYQHPDLHISLLSAWPFTPSKSTVTLPNGIISDFHKLEQTISENQWASIGFADYAQAIQTGRVGLSDPTASVLKNAQAGLRAVGATPASSPRAELGRGYESAETSGHATDGKSEAYVALRNVYLPQHEGFLVIVTSSMISLADAQQLLDQIEDQVQILR